MALREADGRAERLEELRWVADDRGAVARVLWVRLGGALARVDEDRWLEGVDDRGATERCVDGAVERCRLVVDRVVAARRSACTEPEAREGADQVEEPDRCGEFHRRVTALSVRLWRAVVPVRGGALCAGRERVVAAWLERWLARWASRNELLVAAGSWRAVRRFCSTDPAMRRSLLLAERL